jgi:hypothetical protein
MALRDQPYIPLYIQDYLTDEKLNECSASTQGVYIRIMCIMHKSETYGKIMLKQKYKQIDKQEESKCYAFAHQIDKHLTFDLETIYSAIRELIRENVLFYDGDYICQKRMIKDNELSLKRASAGKKGGKKTQTKNKDFALAKNEATTENENENEYKNEDDIKNESKFNFKSSLVNLGVEKTIASDWLKVRSKKKAANTETAFNSLKTQIDKSKLPANDCIRIAVENSWAGFKAEWVENLKPKSKEVKPPKQFKTTWD